MATPNATFRIPEELIQLMDKAIEEIKKGTTRRVTRTDIAIDAIEAYCKSVLSPVYSLGDIPGANTQKKIIRRDTE